MSFEVNKTIGAILTAFLVLLLASFISDLVYPIHDSSETKHSEDNNHLSYYIEDEESDKDLNDNITLENIEKKPSKDEIILLLQNADLNEGSKFAKKNCSSCHSLDDPTKNKIGPSLVGVFGRESASISNYKYSKSFKNLNVSWDEYQLYNFLVKPRDWISGTKMSYGGIKKESDRYNVISYLKKLTYLPND